MLTGTAYGTSMLHDLISRQLCAWELWTLAADCSIPATAETARSNALRKRRQVRELYQLINSSEAGAQGSWKPDCRPPAARGPRDLPDLFDELAAHELESLMDYTSSILRAPLDAANLLAQQRAEIQESLADAKQLGRYVAHWSA